MSSKRNKVKEVHMKREIFLGSLALLVLFSSGCARIVVVYDQPAPPPPKIEIKSDPENNLYFDENEFNAMGYRLMGKTKMKEAMEIFKLNVDLHPESANAYDSLGEVYMHSGDIKNSIKNFKKSLELNPGNDNAKEMLKKLEKK